MPTSPLYTPGVIKLDFGFTYGGKNFHIIRWCKDLNNNVGFAGVALTQFATTAQAAIGPIVAFMSTDVTFDGTTCIDWTNSSGASESVVAGGTGAGAPPTLPVMNAAEIALKIARRYRGGKPKMFISGIPENQLNFDNSWKAAFVSGMDAAAASFLSNVGFVGTVGTTPYNFIPVNFSKFSGHAERPAAVVDPIIGSALNAFVAAQRRRRGRI